MPDQNAQHLMNEKDLPADLQFVEREPIVTGSASAPAQQGIDRYQGAVLSAPLGLDTDIAKSQLPGANPAYRLMPASIAGNPASNASIQSTAAKTIAATPTTAVETVTLDVPSIFTPVTQTVTLPGPLAFSLASENPGTVLAAPVASLSALEDVNNVAGETTNSYTNTATPTSPTSWGLFVSLSTNPPPTPSGWTDIGGQSTLFGKSFTGTSPVTVTLTPAGGLLNSVSMLAIFSGTLITSVQARQASATGVGSGTLAFSSANTAGNTIIVVLQAQNSGTAVTLGASDSNGNTYEVLGQGNAPYDSTNGVPACSQIILVAANIVGGSNTVTYEFNGTAHPFFSFKVFIFEVSPLPSGSGIPLFRNLTSSDLPPINASKINSGQVQLPNGGTGANLQATGGAHQFVKQSSAGAVFTVGQPDFSDLAGAAGQQATSYNGIALVSNGLASEIAKVDLTNQSANIGATTLYAVPATGQQMYRVSAYVVETTPDGASSTLPNVQIVYTDFDSNTSVTLDATPILAGAGLGQSAILTNNAAGTTASGVIVINPKASTNIQYQTVNYASGTPATMKYALHIKLEAL